MKKGAIIYLLGDALTRYEADIEEVGKKLNIKADMVQVVSSMDKNFDLMYAWWFLTAKGMKSVTCLTAEFLDRGSIKLTGKELRLCG